MKLYLKRVIGMVLFVVFLASLHVSALADPYDLEDALALVGQGYDRIEIKDDFSDYNWKCSAPYDYNDGKIMILWREGPLKEFETLSQPISEDYTGNDIGNAKTYLCAGLMEQIPEELRATTPEEVGNIILIETESFVSGVISSYEDVFDYTFTDMDIERMLQGESIPIETYYALVMQSDPDYYKPVFATVVITSVFNAETGGCVLIDSDYFEHAEMRSNPEAADIWETMGYYGDFLDAFAAVDGKIDITEEELDRNLENISLISEKDYKYFSFLREQSLVYPEIPLALMKRYWEMAEELVEQEKDPQVKDSYQRAIEAENRGVFELIANTQSYAGVSMSDETIVRELYYIGRPSPERMEEMLQEEIDLLDEYLDWDLEYLALLN